MSTNSLPRAYSRKSAGVLLLVGVLAGVTVGGGVGVIAASTTKTVTVCADNTTNMLRYAKGGTCSETETPVVLNQTGPVGKTGKTGATGRNGKSGKAGATGAKGDTGAAGAKGDTGAKGDSGAKGDTGPAGPTGATGSGGSGGGASAPVATGTNCIASKCTYVIGDTGPGGGIIFFVDSIDQYTGVNYLEVAPVGWGNGITVDEGGLTGETTGSSTVDPKMKWCSDTTLLLGLNAWAKSAIGTGASNTSTADTTCAGGAIQAASDYAGGSKSDWFLPSFAEAMFMYSNLRPVGVGGFASADYWSSSENDATTAGTQRFALGFQSSANKSNANFVRPVRAF
jgi:hypothetical protein